MKTIIIHQDLLQKLQINQQKALEQNTFEKAIRFTIEQITCEIDKGLGTIELLNKENSICFHIYNGKIVKITIEQLAKKY